MKRRMIGVLMLTLILTSTLNMAFIIRSSLAEDGENSILNEGFMEKMSEATSPNKADKLYAEQEKTSVSPSQTSRDDGDKWNFNDTSEWSNFAYLDGNKTRLILGVDGEEPTSLVEVERIAAKHQAKIVNTVSIGGHVRAAVVELLLVSVTAFVEEIHVAGLASYIEPNMKVQAQFVPNDPYWSLQWGPQKIEADWAWNTTVGDPSVLMAVVDTGIDYTHPDLAANYAPLGYDWVNMDADPLDDFGHGTHCAGIIGAVLNNGVGIAGLAQVGVMAEKVLDSWGYGYWDWVASGIIHATNMSADIISMSLGRYADSELVHEAVRYAYDAGVLIIAAAGNDNTNMKSYPAAYSEVIAVSATDQYDNKAGFSNWGEWIELAAPGVYIYSTLPTYYVTLNGFPYYCDLDYDYLSGTSMACPHVAGVAALVWSLYPSKTRDWVRLWLRCATDDLGDSGFDVYYGYGRVNARKAVEQTPPAHELIAYEWRTPPYVEPGASGTINASILNFGESDEADITVQLLANETMVDSTLIDSLASGNSTTISLAWNPTVEGLYNVTLYVEPAPGETSLDNNVLWKYIYVGFLVKAVVLHSAGNIYGNIIANWQVLSSEWYLFGETMVYIDYTTLNKEDITYEDIANTEADVLIISCAYDPWMGWQFTDSEIEAIRRYVHEGHGLIATAETLYYYVPNNNKLAPLFGLNETTMWTSTGTDLLHLLNTTHPLFRNVPNPFVFTDVGTAIPYDWRWDSNELVDGKYLALGHYQESAIVAYRGLVYVSPWLEVIPPYYHHHLQLLYNAITWSRYQKPEHELVVSLETPKRLNPSESTLLNATVFNRGRSNETNVELQLLIDGVSVDNLTIPELLVDSSYTLSYPWTPTVQGMYNVTAYAPPISGEEFTQNNIAKKTVLVLLITVRNALVYTDDYAVARSSRYVIVALDNLGINYTHYADDPWGFGAALVSQPWDLVVVDHCNYYAMGNYWTELEEYVRNGGLLVLSTFDIDGSDSEPTTLWDALGVRWVSEMWWPEPVYRWVPSHPIFTFPNTVGDLTSFIEGYWDDGDHVAATTGTAIAGFTTTPTEGYAAIVASNNNQTVLFSFLLCEFRYDQDGDGKLDAVELWENAIVCVTKPLEHDIAVTLEAPAFTELGNSTVLNATVRNRGQNNETGVELYLLINDTVVSSATIHELLVGNSYTIDYTWTPMRTGNYNITAYAVPAPGEEYIANNAATKWAYVFFYKRLYLSHEWVGGGVPMGWHADDSSWQYTLPFEFPFYGINYRTIYISSNGLITFIGPDASWGNSIPALAGKLAIAPAWDDWVTYDPYDIYIWQNSTNIGIRWYVAAYYDRSIVANFETMLSFDGVIQFNYGYNNGTVSATLGISNGIGHVLAEDLSNLNHVKTIVFLPFLGERDVAIISVEPATNEVVAGDTVDIDVVVENQGNFTEDFTVTAYATLRGNSSTTAYAASLISTRIYLDPSECIFSTDTVYVGYRFNVTVKVADVEDLTTWQVGIYYNGGMIRATRWFEPTWNPEYVFYGKTTLTAEDIGEDYIVVGAVLFPVQESFNGSGKLCIIEFEITAVPPEGETYSCSLNINNIDTFLIDSSRVNDIPVIKENGYYALRSISPGRYIIGTSAVTGLAPGERRTLTFTWNTTDVPPGDYTIHAKASIVRYEIDKEDNVCYDGVITVKPAVVIVHDVAVTDVVVSSNVAFQGWVVSINVTVANFGNGTENFTATLYYDSNVISTQNVQNLEPNATLTLSFAWNTRNVPCGHNYTIKAAASTILGETSTANNEFVDGQVEIRVMGDVDGDGVVNMRDVTAAILAFNSFPESAKWNPYADLDQNGRVNMRDIVIAILNFNKHC